MLKLTLVAGLAGATLGLLALDVAPSYAQCLNPYAGAVPLSHYDMVPNEGYGYDKSFVNQQLAKGNRCPTAAPTQQAYPYPYYGASPRMQYNRRPNPNANLENGRYY